jgi:hypothetical protein
MFCRFGDAAKMQQIKYQLLQYIYDDIIEWEFLLLIMGKYKAFYSMKQLWIGNQIKIHCDHGCIQHQRPNRFRAAVFTSFNAT